MGKNDAPGPPSEATQPPDHPASSDLTMTNHAEALEAQVEQPISKEEKERLRRNANSRRSYRRKVEREARAKLHIKPGNAAEGDELMGGELNFNQNTETPTETPVVKEPPTLVLEGSNLGGRVDGGVGKVEETGEQDEVSEGVKQWYEVHTIKREKVQLTEAQLLARNKRQADHREKRRLQKEREIANGQRDANGRLMWWPNKLKEAREARERKAMETEGYPPQGSDTQKSPTQESPPQHPLIQDPLLHRISTEVSPAEDSTTQEPLAQEPSTQGPKEGAGGRAFESKKRKREPKELSARIDEQRETSNQKRQEKRKEEARQEIDLGLGNKDRKLKQIQYRQPKIEAVLSGSGGAIKSSAHESPVQGPSTRESSIQQPPRRSGRIITSKIQVVEIFEKSPTPHPVAQESPIKDSPAQKSTPHPVAQKSPVKDSPTQKPTPHPVAQKSPIKDSPTQKPTHERGRAHIVNRPTADELEERIIRKIQKQREVRQQQKELEVARGLRDANGKLLWWSNKQKQAREAKEEEKRAMEEASVQECSTVVSPEARKDVGVSTITPNEHQQAEEASYTPYAYAHTEAVIRNSGWTPINASSSSDAPQAEPMPLSSQWWKALQ